jgi:hypothetical protein
MINDITSKLKIMEAQHGLQRIKHFNKKKLES